MSDAKSLVEIIGERKTAWNAEELADLLGLTRKHVLKMAKAQRIPSYRLGGAVKFDPKHTAAWLEKRLVGN